MDHKTGRPSQPRETSLDKLATKISKYFRQANDGWADTGLNTRRSYTLPPLDDKSPQKIEWDTFARTFWSKAQIKRMFNTDAGSMWDQRCNQVVNRPRVERRPNNWIGSWRVREELAQSILYALVTGEPQSEWCLLFDNTNTDLMAKHVDVLSNACVSEWLAARSSTVRRALELPADVFAVDMSDRLTWSTLQGNTPMQCVVNKRNRVGLGTNSREKLLKLVATTKDVDTVRCPSEKECVSDSTHLNSIVSGSLNAGALSFAIDNLVLVWEFVIANKMVSPRFPLGKVFEGSSCDMESVVGSIVALLEIGKPFDTDVSVEKITTITNINSHPTVQITISAVDENVLEAPTDMTRIRVVCTQWNHTQGAKKTNHTRELERLRLNAFKLTGTRGRVFVDVSLKSSGEQGRNPLAKGGGTWKRGDPTSAENRAGAIDYQIYQVAKTFRKKMPFTVVSIDPPFFAQGGSDSPRRFLPHVFFGSRLLTREQTEKECVMSKYSNDYKHTLESITKISKLVAIGGMTPEFADSIDWFSRYEHHAAPLEHKKEWEAEFDGREEVSFTIPRGAPVPQIRCGLGGSITKASEVWAFLCGVLNTQVLTQSTPLVRVRVPIMIRQTITENEWMQATSLIFQAVNERNSDVFSGVGNNAELCNPVLVPPIVALGWNGPMMRKYCRVFVTLFGERPNRQSYNVTFWTNLYKSIKARLGEITLLSIGNYLDRHRKVPPMLTINAETKDELKTEQDNFFDRFEKKWKFTNSQLRRHVIDTIEKTGDVEKYEDGTFFTNPPDPGLGYPTRSDHTDAHLKYWLLEADRDTSKQRHMQWLRVRKSIFDAAALDDDKDVDNHNGPFPLQSVENQNKFGGLHFLRGACRFYYAMVQCRTTMHHVYNALDNVDTLTTGRRNESHFKQIMRCVHRTNTLFDCINAGTYRHPGMAKRRLFKIRTELLGVGNFDSNDRNIARTTDGPSTDLVQTPLDEDEEGYNCNVARVVAAMKSPAEFAANYRSQEKFQNDVQNVLGWFFDWIIANRDKTAYRVLDDCDLNGTTAELSSNDVNTEAAPSWAQLVRTCHAVANLVGASTTMFDILNEYSPNLQGQFNEELEQGSYMGSLIQSLSESLFRPKTGDNGIERFTEQAMKGYAPVFEDFVVNGVMHSLETAAAAGVGALGGDVPTDITRRGAKEWLKCQYRRVNPEGAEAGETAQVRSSFADAEEAARIIEESNTSPFSATNNKAALLTKGAVVWSETRKETGRVVAVGQLTGNSDRSVYDDVVVEFAGNRVVSVLPASVTVLLGAAA